MGKHPIQLYSMATPNGQKVTIALEEMGLKYDAWFINIMQVQIGRSRATRADVVFFPRSMYMGREAAFREVECVFVTVVDYSSSVKTGRWYDERDAKCSNIWRTFPFFHHRRHSSEMAGDISKPVSHPFSQVASPVVYSGWCVMAAFHLPEQEGIRWYAVFEVVATFGSVFPDHTNPCWGSGMRESMKFKLYDALVSVQVPSSVWLSRRHVERSGRDKSGGCLDGTRGTALGQFVGL